MNRNLFALGVVLLLAAFLVVLRQGATEDTPLTGQTGKNQTGSRTRIRAEEKLRHLDASTATPEQASAHLRALLKAGLENAPRFEEIEALARRVETADLLTLADPGTDLIGHSLRSWVRCAALAELGRRIPEETLSQLAPNPQTTVWLQTNPALFSLFRGWSEVDPQAALQQLAETWAVPRHADKNTYDRSEEWKEHAYTAGFTELARLGPREAVAMLPPAGVEKYRTRAWEGIFAGTNDPEELRELFDLWNADRINTRPELAVFLAPENQGLGLGRGPEDSGVILECALSLAESNLTDAVVWMKSSPLVNQDLELVSEVVSEYAERHPDQALDLIRSGFDPFDLAVGVGMAHPDRVGEMLETLPDFAPRGDILWHIIQAHGLLSHDDLYPTPGRPSRLPNFEQRLNELRSAIEGARLEPGRRAELLELLDQEFDISVLSPADPENAGQ